MKGLVNFVCLIFGLFFLLNFGPMFGMEEGSTQDISVSQSDNESNTDAGFEEIKGLERDHIDTKIIKFALGQALFDHDALTDKDVTEIKKIGVKLVSENPSKYSNLTSVRSRRQRLNKNQKKDISALKEQVLVAYINSKKGEAKKAEQKYQLQLRLAREAREEADWQHKFSLSSLGLSACNIFSTVLLGSAGLALNIYVASQV